MLNENDFKSIFKNEITYFIKYKRSLGCKYDSQIRYLRRMDKLLFNLKLKSKKITKQTFCKLTNMHNLKGFGYMYQYIITNDFCKHLISGGYKNIYHRDKKFRIEKNYQPVIFNNDEIKVLFEAMDAYAKEHKGKKNYPLYYTYSILFRLIYSCGLRVSESIKITMQNINFDENSINIIDSKGHVSRIVVFSDSMKQCLEKYLNIFKFKEGLLFRNRKGNIIKRSALEVYYKKLLAKANLKTKAHIHDLRHNFCNDAFNQMLEKGFNENVVLVYLNKYMGHKQISETEYYLHFTDYNRNKLIENNKDFSKSLYEGVDLSE